MEVFRNLPHDIIHEILDYFNYAKYCKSEHKEAFSTTLSNINDFRSVFTTGIKPIIVKKCLGKVNYIESWGIATTRYHVEELLQPYWEMITLRNTYCNELKLSNGTNKQTGTATLNGGNPGTVTVSNSLVSASSLIFLTKQTGNHPGGVLITTKGTGTFTITSTENGDTDEVAWMIINPS